MLRENYRIATLNCGGEDFAVACMRSNLRYGKNQKREDVKSHHYIISFDPRDAADNGLTVDRAQVLGEEFCRKQFPGHQAIVCTHPDGHNHSGNIHVHIVINSLRIAEVPFLPYMDRPADTRTGCKHRCTDTAMEYFKAEVMELCHRENLYQIDLLHGSKNRITEREYWAQRKGQAKLDKEAAALPAEEQPAKPTKFETDKEKLRQAIRTALSSAASYGEFAAVLLQQGVTVKEGRGRLSYLTPDRTKPITARPIRYQRQVSDRKGKIFYTSITSLSHISKFRRILLWRNTKDSILSSCHRNIEQSSFFSIFNSFITFNHKR